MDCSEGRRRARAKLDGMCFRKLCFQNLAKTGVLAFAPSKQVFDQHRQVLDKEKFYDKKEGDCFPPRG